MTTILYLYYFIINLTGAVLSRTNINFSFFLNGHINYIMLHNLCHPIKLILYIMCFLNMCILCIHWEILNEIMSVLARWSKDSESEFLSMLDPSFPTGKQQPHKNTTAWISWLKRLIKILWRFDKSHHGILESFESNIGNFRY